MANAPSLFGLAMFLVVGCSSGRDDGPQQVGPTGGAGATAVAGGAPGSAGATSSGAGSSGASVAGAAPVAGASSAGGAAGSPAGGSASNGGAGTSNGGVSSLLDAPSNASELQAFLDAKRYSGWAKEAAYHQSSGPHGDGVRVFYSPRAAAALSSGAATFPAGAATVKELSSGGSLYGWAVWVKVQAETNGGNGFYWYEIIHQGGGKDSIYGNALGSNDCVGCHVAGKDYDLSTLPFQ
jgi:hypothetical protein